MPHPIIILGAGASHDYIHPKCKHPAKILVRPPLTDELCDPIYADMVETYSREVQLLSATLLSKISPKKTLEDCLAEIKNKAIHNLERQKELIAFEFYLQELFQKISSACGGQFGNNFDVLRGHINDDAADGKACIITFNYDTLLEQCLGINKELNSYISGNIKLIKLHGSCDWVYGLGSIFEHYSSSYDFLMENPTYPTMHQSKSLFPFRTEEYRQTQKDRTLDFCPAIATPLPGKTGYICPDKHIEEMKKALSETDRILIIGWRAGDKVLIKILEETIRRSVFITIVSDSIESAEKVEKNLNHIVSLSFNLSKHGFSGFLRSGECDDFFT